MKSSQKYLEGYLILVIGNSGSGKDTIIKEVISRNKSLKLTAPKRYVTRMPSVDEDNIFLTEEEFQQKSEKNEFAIEWEIYGLKYAVPMEINDWLNDGYYVIINVSRNVVEKTKKKYRNCKVIFIEVPFELTRKRILERGREGNAALENRIARAEQNQKYPEADFVVDNSGELDTAVNQFVRYLNSLETTKN
jgi:ribose 1,5-bisphosphokinase